MHKETSSQASIGLLYRGVALLGAVSFVAGALTGIWRISLIRGFVLPPIPEWWPPHGHLIAGGFLAAVIMFERIIALRIKALSWVPYAYVLSALLLHTRSPIVFAVHLMALAGWIAHRWMAYRAFHKYEKPLIESAAYVTLSAALCYPGGLTAAPIVALAALSFPVATILVERLEMALNFRKVTARVSLYMLVVWCACWAMSAWFDVLSLSTMGWLTLLIAAITLRQDMTLWARRKDGILQKFLQRSLALGYFWFFLFAIALIGWESLPGAVMKDVVFHLLGLGFIFTMILAHAPLILPAAIGKLPPSTVPLIPFVAFQILTAVRILADLLVGSYPVFWMWTGWITGLLHLLAFIAYMGLLLRSLGGWNSAGT